MIQTDELCRIQLDFHGKNSTYGMHGLHPYGAKFPPQLPRWVIERLSEPGELVLDPFAGSGTALVEARILGRHAAGGDVDPLAKRIALAKATPLESEALRAASLALVREVENVRPHLVRLHTTQCYGESAPPHVQLNGYWVEIPTFPNRDYWFSPQVSIELALLAHLITQVEDVDHRRLFEVVLSSCIISKKHSSVANVADLVHTRPHYLAKPEPPDVLNLFLNKLKWALRRVEKFNHEIDTTLSTQWVGDDIRTGLNLPDNSVHLIVTSPPYVAALDYPRTHKFALHWLGVGYDEYHALTYDHIGLQRAPVTRWKALKIQDVGLKSLDGLIATISQQDIKAASLVKRYLIDLRIAMQEMYRVLAQNRYAVIVIGVSTVHGHVIDSPAHVESLGRMVGLEHIHTILRRLDVGKRYLPFKKNGIDGGIHEEAVIFFRKP